MLEMDWISVILLLFVGIVLVVVEIIFVPGTTIVGIIGTALMCFGVIIGYSKFGAQIGTIYFGKYDSCWRDCNCDKLQIRGMEKIRFE